MSSFGLSEIRGALRGLQRSPIIALSAVACIALGLGSTAAISSAVDRALVQRLPFRAPERIVTVYRTTPHFDTGPFSPLNYLDLARLTTSVSQLAAVGYDGHATLFDPIAGKRVFELRSLAAGRPDDRAAESQVAFSADGSWLLSTNWDGSLNVWDGRPLPL